MRKLFSIAVLASLPLYAGDTVTVKGSDTMVILNQRWAEAYMAGHPGVVIQVTGGGSGTGISSLITGSTDICAASRRMKQEEIDALRERQKSDGVEIPVAKDGVAIYLNETNPLSTLSLPQIKAFFTGTAERWSSVGGPDRRTVLYSRENNSGTYVFFKEHVLKNEDFSDFALTLPGTAGVVNAVSRDPWGIGYGGSSSKTGGVKVCAVSAKDGEPAFLPTEENILSGTYPASRDLFYYVISDKPGPTMDFIHWVLSDEGQAVVVKAGYFPMKKGVAPK
jgi:phosphate transport system substrate-binding protein